MTLPARTNIWRTVSNLAQRLSVLEAGLPPWNYPEILAGSNAGAPFSDLAYRRGTGPQEMQWKGHWMPGESGDVIFIVDQEFLGDFDGDHTWLTDIVAGSSGFQIARVYFDVTTGEVSVEFPVTV